MWGHQERVYYDFSEIIEACGISKTGLDNCILNGAVAVHAWVPPTSVHEVAETVVGNQVLLTKTERHWDGYAGIFPNDYRKILQRGHAYLREFLGERVNETILLKNGATDIDVCMQDLVVLAAEKKRLEEYLGLRVDKECTVEIVGRVMGARKSGKAQFDPTFRHVSFKGRDFLFGPVQAAVVKQLYAAAKSGEPWQSGKKLLQEAGSESFSLRNVFARQPFWRELIESDSRGLYRLHEEFILGTAS